MIKNAENKFRKKKNLYKFYFCMQSFGSVMYTNGWDTKVLEDKCSFLNAKLAHSPMIYVLQEKKIFYS